MQITLRLVRLGDRLLSILAGFLILVMFLYGGYSLWDTARIYGNAAVGEELLKYKPSETEEEHLSLKELSAINPDVRGWLTITDTNIDYPLVQGENDMEYINKDVFGDFSLSGALFLSCINSSDFSDGYSLIYGHHMDNGGMFGDVVEYTDASYFEKHTEGWLYLTDATYQIHMFACVETDAYDSMIYGCEPDTDLDELLSYIEEHAVVSEKITTDTPMQVIGLSTCADARTNGRVIVFGRLEKIS